MLVSALDGEVTEFLGRQRPVARVTRVLSSLFLRLGGPPFMVGLLCLRFRCEIMAGAGFEPATFGL